MRRRSSATATAAVSAFLAAGILSAAGAPPIAVAPAPPAASAAPNPAPAPARAESPDAFYLARLRIGQQALAAGRAAEAADNLRVASFGLLGDPGKLTECLVWLAIAQQRAGRTADVDATLKRFQAVQALYPSYGEIVLGTELRSEFEALARKRAPGIVLERPREAVSPPAQAPAAAPGPAIVASLRPAPVAVPIASAVSPRRASVAAAPVAAPKVAAAAAASSPKILPRPATFDRDLRTRGEVIFEIRPDQARIFVDGRYVGVSADWGGAGGRPFPFAAGEHTVRALLPGYRELRLRVVADPSASADAVAAVELVRRERRSFRRIPRPDYVTGGRVAFGPELAGADVAVDGEATGPANRFTASAPMRLSGPAVHEVVLSKAGRPARTIRILASPTAGDGLVTVRTGL